MSEYFKFPSTKHILLPKAESMREDKVLSSEELFEMLSHEVIVEEKVDGANLGISFDHNGELHLQNRGNWILRPYVGQWKRLGEWLSKKQNLLFDFLLDQYILFGEWCYAVHSIYYDKLPDYFIGFDIYDQEHGAFLSVKRRNVLLESMEISVIHQLAEGRYHLEDLKVFLGASYYGSHWREGIYLRWDENGWLKRRAKLVRYEFQQSIAEHWQKNGLKANRLLREF